MAPETLEIISFPDFDRSIRDEDIARYVFRAQTCRNRRIGDFLKELHLVEGHNTGYPTMLVATGKLARVAGPGVHTLIGIA